MENLYLSRAQYAAKEEISMYLRDLGVKWVQKYLLDFINDMNIPNEIKIYSRVGGIDPCGTNKPEVVEAYGQELKKLITEHKNRINISRWVLNPMVSDGGVKTRKDTQNCFR